MRYAVALLLLSACGGRGAEDEESPWTPMAVDECVTPETLSAMACHGVQPLDCWDAAQRCTEITRGFRDNSCQIGFDDPGYDFEAFQSECEILIAVEDVREELFFCAPEDRPIRGEWTMDVEAARAMLADVCP